MLNNYDEHFTDDKLGIQPYVLDFAHLIEQETFQEKDEAKVYSISANFGIGKTFFCKKLKRVLNADKIPNTEMNIWEMDFYETPLIPILIKIRELYDEHNKLKPAVASTAKKVKNVIKAATVTGIKNTVKKTTGFDFDDFLKTYNSLDNKSDIYEKYKEYEKELHKLKSALGDWAAAERKKGMPIVIIIDELDRCRPDYAIKTLESLKHFFDIPGFVFVLALDETQLKSSVKCLFGTENFDGYKRKFINNSFLLPEPNKIKFTRFLYKKTGIEKIINKIQGSNRCLIFKAKNISAPFQKSSIGSSSEDISKFNQLQTPESIIIRYFAAYSKWFKFTLRQMEQTFDRLTLFTKKLYSSNELFSPDLAVLLVCLHEFDSNIYNKLRKDCNVYGQNNGVIRKIYNIGDTGSLAYRIYDKQSFEMFDRFDRNISPRVPVLEDFSSIGSSVFINDNVDRFFNTEPNQPGSLKLVIEFQDNNNVEPNNIDTNRVLATIISSKRDEKWEKPDPDINTAEGFDLIKFRQNYFSKMDFISHFIDNI